MSVKCFMVNETERFRATLRRYVLSSTNKCPSKAGYHNAHGPELGIVVGIKDPDGYWSLSRMDEAHGISHEDPRWPSKCSGCDYVFQPTDEWQASHDHIYIDAAGQEYSLHGGPAGMMWFADYGGDDWKGPDGHSLMVRCPGGHDWCIDSMATNCTKKDDVGPYGKAHRCWIRHGTPPLITVDKNGLTCAAGAGSIAVPNYHGFLRNGEFT